MLEVYPDIQPLLIGFIAGFFAAAVLVGGVCAIWFWDREPRAAQKPLPSWGSNDLQALARESQTIIQDWGNGLGGH